jgi:tetratricopeptide (TPR) repeat protein
MSYALEIGHLSTVGWIEYIYGCLLAMKGDGRSAAAHLQNAIKYMEEVQSVVVLGLVWAWLGYAHSLMGQSKIAIDLTEKGLAMHTDLGLPFWRSICHWTCSHAHLEGGDLGKARTHAEQALQFSLEGNERQMEATSEIWLGRIMARTDPSEIQAAEGKIRRGIRLLEELEILYGSAEGYLWLGEVYAESGRQEEALENLKKAEGMFRDMGMDYWLAKAQEALAKLRDESMSQQERFY